MAGKTRTTWSQEQYEKFVVAWQTSSNVGEVVEKTGLSRKTVVNRAAMVRKKGVPLKKLYFRGRPAKLDWEKLINLSNEYAKKK